MAGKRKRRVRRSSSSSSSSDSSSSSGDRASSVSSILPDDASAAPGDGAGSVPPLPPDSAASSSSSSSSSGDRSGTVHDAPDLEEVERRQRVAVIAGLLSSLCTVLPPSVLGGPLPDDQAELVAGAWELALRPYWDSVMGPWSGAVLTTVAVFGPRVMVARMEAAQTARADAAARASGNL